MTTAISSSIPTYVQWRELQKQPGGYDGGFLAEGTPVDIPASTVSKATSEQMAVFEESKRHQAMLDENGEMVGGTPEDIWGKITLQGEVIATIYKSGLIDTAHEYNIDYTSDSPEDRAKQVLDTVGGTLVRTDIEGDPQKALMAGTPAEIFINRFADRLALMTDATKSLYLET